MASIIVNMSLSSISCSSATTKLVAPSLDVSGCSRKFFLTPPLSWNSRISFNRAGSCAAADRLKHISSLDSLFSYDKAIPEQIIEKPVGLSICEKEIGDQPRCTDCEAKGVVLCATCAGSGLYVDSIMECQGIIVKVRCLGCGGTGNIMCSECGGRSHL